MNLLEEKPEIVSHIRKILTVLSIRYRLDSTPFYLILNVVKKQLSYILKIDLIEISDTEKSNLNILIKKLADEFEKDSTWQI